MKADYPHLSVSTELVKGKHPYLKGEYTKGAPRVIGVKNLSVKDIASHVTNLRQHTNDKATILKKKVLSKTPSIQGKWTVDTFA